MGIFPIVKGIAEVCDIVGISSTARGMPAQGIKIALYNLDGDRTPLDLRVSPARAAELERATPKARERWRKTMQKGRDLTPSPRLPRLIRASVI